MEEYKKKYEEALEKAKEEIKKCGDNKGRIRMIENIFPELKESEDERIRKATIEFVRQNKSFNYSLGISKEDAIAWLEKQGEQKTTDKVEPKFKVGDTIRLKGSIAEYTIESIDAECYHGSGWGLPISAEDNYELVEHKSAWSEEDEKMWSTISDLLWEGYKLSDEKVSWDKIRCWLLPKIKSLKERVQPQPKQEWSEEDKKLIDDTCNLINTLASGYGENVTEPITLSGTQMIASIKDRLRALVDNRPQSTWKPSDEQMEALWNAIPHIPNSEKDIDTITELSVLYEDLKKLM